MTSMLRWRAMQASDLEAVAAIERIVHPQFAPEGVPILGERQRLWPAGCSVLEASGRVVGYLVGYPWLADAPPALGSELGRLPAAPTSYYIHDLALLPEARGAGLAASAVVAAIDTAGALNLPELSLVAVHSSAAFWQRFGFEVQDVPTLTAKLASFGTDARYMVRRSTDVGGPLRPGALPARR